MLRCSSRETSIYEETVLFHFRDIENKFKYCASCVISGTLSSGGRKTDGADSVMWTWTNILQFYLFSTDTSLMYVKCSITMKTVCNVIRILKYLYATK